MSAKDGNAGIGCGGGLLIVVALCILLGLSGLGSDTSKWDCPGQPAPCKEGK